MCGLVVDLPGEVVLIDRVVDAYQLRGSGRDLVCESTVLAMVYLALKVYLWWVRWYIGIFDVRKNIIVHSKNYRMCMEFLHRVKLRHSGCTNWMEDSEKLRLERYPTIGDRIGIAVVSV